MTNDELLLEIRYCIEGRAGEDGVDAEAAAVDVLAKLRELDIIPPEDEPITIDDRFEQTRIHHGKATT